MSNALSAMWVAPDGTCYASSYWDEGGRPVTSYRDGRAARGLPIGTPQTAEGAITGDAGHLFVAAADRIVQLDPAQPDFAPQPLCLSVNLLDSTKNHSVVSGLASDGRRLFVADSRENLIRVVSVAADLAPEKYHVAQAANDGVLFAPQPVVVPPGDPRFAPAIVYQTQRGGEGNPTRCPVLFRAGSIRSAGTLSSTLFTSGQGNIGNVNIFRYDGELAIPAGGTREHGRVLWIDRNGDGREPEPRPYQGRVLPQHLQTVVSVIPGS